MKRIILWLTVFATGIFFFVSPVSAQTDRQVTVHLFYGEGCPHCVKEKTFLEKMEEKYPQITVKYYEVSKQENIDLLREISQKLNIKISGVPFTTVGKNYVIGYHSDETTGKEIEDGIRCAIETGCEDIVSGVTKPSLPDGAVVPEEFKIPLLGNLKTRNLSLPALSVVLGVLDGFNPCAMWTLLFLISLLLGMKDKKRMWILGIAFIVTSALVYFMIMAAWLNFFLLLGMVIWVRLAIGMVALGAGSYNLREYWLNREGCKVTGNEKRRRVFERIKEITHKKSFLLALVGIILLAIAVNVVELVCSAGLPAVFTQVLALNDLTRIRYYTYIALYIFFFMIDDLFVFFAAMITMQMTGISTKYSRYSNLIGGLLMLLLGVLLLFKPSWLMFG